MVDKRVYRKGIYMGDKKENGWQEHKRLILDQLKRNEAGVNRLSEEVREMREEQAILSQNTKAISSLQDRVGSMEKNQIKLQVKAGLIGVVSTIIGSSVIGIIIKILFT